MKFLLLSIILFGVSIVGNAQIQKDQPYTAMQSRTLPAGKTDTAPLSIPADATYLTTTFDAKSFSDPKMTCTVWTEISYDAGQTWRDLGGSTLKGGPLYDDDHKVVTSFTETISLGQVGNPNRWVRTHIQVISGSFPTDGLTLTAK